MVTPDKDFAISLRKHLCINLPVWVMVSRLGNSEVLEKFEIERPEQVIDYLGMMGDAADNIPGLA
jgi:DNA polymerase-1